MTKITKAKKQDLADLPNLKLAELVRILARQAAQEDYKKHS